MIEINVIRTIIIIIFFIFSAMPLHKAIKFFKGRTKFIRTLYIVFISGVILTFISIFIKIYLGIISSLTLIYIYKKSFKLKWFKAFLVWLIQLILVTTSSIITEIIINLLFNFFI